MWTEGRGWVCDDCGVQKLSGGSRCRACYLARCNPTPRPKLLPAEALASGKSVDLAKLERAIIKPGFERDLEQLLYFRGTRHSSVGRMHRIWNYAISGMLHEATPADMTQRLGCNENFSQLCMPVKRPSAIEFASFVSRFRRSPSLVTAHQELFDYCDYTARHDFELIPVAKESHYKTNVPWRMYVPPPRVLRSSDGKPWGSPREKPRPIERHINPYEFAYPFIRHEAKSREPDPLVSLLERAVPKHLDRETRADLCQDLAVAILCGDLKREDLQDGIRCYLPKVRKMFPTKYGPLSLDAPMPDGRSWHDVIAADENYAEEEAA